MTNSREESAVFCEADCGYRSECSCDLKRVFINAEGQCARRYGVTPSHEDLMAGKAPPDTTLTQIKNQRDLIKAFAEKIERERLVSRHKFDALSAEYKNERKRLETDNLILVDKISLLKKDFKSQLDEASEATSRALFFLAVNLPTRAMQAIGTLDYPFEKVLFFPPDGRGHGIQGIGSAYVKMVLKEKDRIRKLLNESPNAVAARFINEGAARFYERSEND